MSTTILKGFQVIEFLSHAGEPKGISEIAREIDMNKSAVQRILRALQNADYVEQPPGTSKYQLTLSIWELGSHVVERHQARRLLHPILGFGSISTGFTSFLAYGSFPFLVYLDKVEGAHGRSHTSEPGTRIPITRTAGGKCITAYHPPEDIATLAQDHTDWTGYVQFNGVSLPDLELANAEIRKNRYATTEGGTKPGVNSIAAPIWWRDVRPYGSIILTADEKHMPREEFPAIGARVVQMAEEATLALGGIKFQRQAEKQFC